MSFPCSPPACYKRYCNLRCKLSILVSISSETQISNAIDADHPTSDEHLSGSWTSPHPPLEWAWLSYRELPNASRRSSTCLKTGLATGWPPLDDSTATRKIYGYGQRTFLKIPVYCFHASFRWYSEKLERDVDRYENWPVSSRIPPRTWRTYQPVLLAIAPERVHPALEKGLSRFFSLSRLPTLCSQESRHAVAKEYNRFLEHELVFSRCCCTVPQHHAAKLVTKFLSFMLIMLSM